MIYVRSQKLTQKKYLKKFGDSKIKQYICIPKVNNMNNTQTISRASLLDAYLKFHNVRLASKGKKSVRDGMPFAPMFLMDAMNMIYNKYVSTVPVKHTEKRFRNLWHEAYKSYINNEFQAFDMDQKCEICDLMDEFSAHIHNEVEIFRATVMGKFMQYDADTRLVISGVLACNVLSQSAQIIHRAQYRAENPYIASVESWSLKFLNAYADKRIDRSATKTDLNQYKDVEAACRKICKSIIEYAKQCEF